MKLDQIRIDSKRLKKVLDFLESDENWLNLLMELKAGKNGYRDFKVLKLNFFESAGNTEEGGRAGRVEFFNIGIDYNKTPNLTSAQGNEVLKKLIDIIS